MPRLFVDRREAGKILAARLGPHAAGGNLLVLGLPRGGVPVAYEIATALRAPLDVFVVRKLGAPLNEEFAIGAIASGGIGMIDWRTVSALGIAERDIERVLNTERRELARRETLYRRGRPFPDIAGKTVVLVDDGLATGATMRVAVEAVRSQHPAAVIAAAPVGSREACAMVGAVADACVCAITPEPFGGVGAWYLDFSQTTDDEVLALLDAADAHKASPAAPVPASVEG
jgi:putative phosphoribosyl transferase